MFIIALSLCHISLCPCQSEFSSSLVEFVDILPTLVAAAGLPQLDLCPEYSRNVSLCRQLSLLLSPHSQAACAGRA